MEYQRNYPPQYGHFDGDDIFFWVSVSGRDENGKYFSFKNVPFVARNVVPIVDSMPVPDDLARSVLEEFPRRLAKVTDWYMDFGYGYSDANIRIGEIPFRFDRDDTIRTTVTLPMIVEVMLLDDDNNESIVDEGTVTNVMVDVDMDMTFVYDKDRHSRFYY